MGDGGIGERASWRGRGRRAWRLAAALLVAASAAPGCIQKDAAVPVQVRLPAFTPGDSFDPFAGVSALRLTVRAGTVGGTDMVILAERYFAADAESLSLQDVKGGRDRFVVLEGCAETVEALEGGASCTVISRGATPPGDYLARGQEEPQGKSYSTVWLLFARVGMFSTLPDEGQYRLLEPRAFMASVDLENGKYVFAGGLDEDGLPHNRVEVFDIDGFRFTTTGTLETPRAFAAGVRVPEGGAVIAGGFDALEANRFGLDSAERLDRRGVPLDDVLQLSLGRGFLAGAPVRAEEAMRLVLGGGSQRFGTFGNGAWDPTDADQAADEWTGDGLVPFLPLNVARAWHTATPLSASGRVLFAGGCSAPGVVSDTADVLEHDAPTPYRTISGMGAPRWGHTATLLDPVTGSVLLAGGAPTMSLTSGMGAAQRSIDVFVPGGVLDVDRFLPPADLPLMTTPRAHHAAARMNSGSVLLVGGVPVAGGLPAQGVVPTETTEIYSPSFAGGSGVFVEGPPMIHPRVGHAAFTLPDGNVLVVGGFDAAGVPRAEVEIYVPLWPG